MDISEHLMADKDFPELLQKALSGELPGESAHLAMASRLRRSELRINLDRSNAINSSVLILLYLKNGRTHTVLFQRQTYDGVHSGQVAFPGGRAEPGDENLIATALREASEEVGIIPESVDILGTLTELYIPPSNYLVLPVVGITEFPPVLVPDPSEVAEIIEADLDFLFTPDKHKETLIHVRGAEIEAPYYDVQDKIVWGATAMILSELREVIKSIYSIK